MLVERGATLSMNENGGEHGTPMRAAVSPKPSIIGDADEQAGHQTFCAFDS